jgi:hypothetical protein
MPTFSFTLVQKIEAHSEQIADQVAEAIVRDPGLREMRALHRDELSRRARELLGNLGHWLVARDPEVAKWSEPLGHTRFEQSIPLCELIRGIQIVKEKLIDFARAGMAGTALQIYAEGELEYQVGRFFDAVVYYAAKGYETALRDSTRDHSRTLRAAAAGALDAEPGPRPA